MSINQYSEKNEYVCNETLKDESFNEGMDLIPRQNKSAICYSY